MSAFRPLLSRGVPRQRAAGSASVGSQTRPAVGRRQGGRRRRVGTRFARAGAGGAFGRWLLPSPRVRRCCCSSAGSPPFPQPSAAGEPSRVGGRGVAAGALPQTPRRARAIADGRTADAAPPGQAISRRPCPVAVTLSLAQQVSPRQRARCAHKARTAVGRRRSCSPPEDTDPPPGRCFWLVAAILRLDQPRNASAVIPGGIGRTF